MDIRLERKIHQKKAAVLKIILIVFFGLIFIKSFHLQVIEGERYLSLSEGNRVRIQRVKPLRGTIFDRHGVILADNAPSFTIALTYADMRSHEEVPRLLANLLAIELSTINDLIEKNARRAPYEPYPIIRNATIEQVSRIEEHSYDLPGIKTMVEPVRSYPASYAAAHVLGYMGEVTPGEYEKLKDQDYKIGDQLGKTGLEKQYESYLHGISGYVYMEVDVWGREFQQLTEKPPIVPRAGYNLHLTIDQVLQDSLTAWLSEYDTGAAVAIDPQTGAVLALCSAPTFDPNLFVSGISRDNWKVLNNNPQLPLFNRAIQGTYPPGSTFKLLTSLVGLEQQIITTNTRFDGCSGSYRIGNRSFGCWRQEGHGSLALHGAIVNSCDVYFYQLGLKIPLQIFADYALQSGFAQKSGIDLPDEKPGFFPDEKWAATKFESHSFPRGMLANLSIGQGEVLVTPLQLARFFAALGNGGSLYPPYLVEWISAPENEMIIPERPETSYLSVSHEHLLVLQEALYDVVHAGGGTGHRARVEDLSVCGKTGTAQNPHGDDHAWFAAFAPRENPRIAIAVIVENSGHGGSIAAPIAQKGLALYLGEDTTPITQTEADNN